MHSIMSDIVGTRCCHNTQRTQPGLSAAAYTGVQGPGSYVVLGHVYSNNAMVPSKPLRPFLPGTVV